MNFRLFPFILFVFIFAFTGTTLYSQSTTDSPYSAFGLGDIESPAFANSISMGNTKYALAFPYSVNIANPASYGYHSLPTFDVGFTSNFLTLSYRDSLQKVNNSYFKYLAIAIPVSKRWWASSFGIVPFSKMGYSYSSTDTVENFGKVRYYYNGSGGINRFFLGNTFNILKDSITQFSIGLNSSYLFGTVTKASHVIPDASLLASNTKVQKESTLGDFYFDAGLLFSRKISNVWSFSMGADYEFSKKLKTTGTTLATTYTGTGLSEVTKDTLYLDSLEQPLSLPSKIGAGISVFYNNRWLLAADYSLRDWTQLEISGKNSGLAPTSQLSLGLQYNYNAKERENFFKMLWYRAGFRYAKTPVVVNNIQLNEYGITFGVGLPIGEKSKGSFNLALETGIRGEKKNDLIREQFTNITFGFSFTPSYYDRWFVKPKID